MNDADKSKDELIAELVSLRQQLAHYEESPPPSSAAGQSNQSQEKKLQSLLDTMPHYVYRIDREGHLTFVNRSLIENLGVSLEEVLGKTAYDFYPQELADQYRRDDQQVMSSGQSLLQVEENISPQTNARSFVEIMKIPTYDAHGNINGLQGIFQDVTERKRSEDNLTNAFDQMSRLFQQLPVGIQVFNSDGLCIDANEAHLNIFGVEREAIVWKYNIFEDTLAEEMNTRQAAERALQGETVVLGDLEFVFERADPRYASVTQEPRIVNVSLVPIFDSNKRVTRFVGVNVDITERKRAEERLHQTEANLRAMLNSTTQYFTMVDRNHRVVEADTKGRSSAKILFGRAMRPGDLIYDFVVKENLPIFDDAFNRALEGETVYTEAEFVIEEGETVIFDFTYSPVVGQDGSVTGVCIASQNVTDRKLAAEAALEHERIKSSFKKEQEKNALFQRMVSALSHDLRTPLTVISTSRDLLVHYYDRLSPEKRQQKFDMIDHQIQFMLELLDDLMTLVRGNLSEGRFKPVSLHLAKLCQVSITELQTTQAEKHIINFVNQGKVGIVAVDEILVSRILVNLLSNAVKYSPDGSEIRLELDHKQEGVVLRVVDQGQGMNEDEIRHIFEPFYRAATAKRVPGTGLGLSIVQDCVERHQGSISVSSEVGHGSTFEVWLPLAKTPASASISH